MLYKNKNEYFKKFECLSNVCKKSASEITTVTIMPSPLSVSIAFINTYCVHFNSEFIWTRLSLYFIHIYFLLKYLFK